jgi:hypothetical protein
VFGCGGYHQSTGSPRHAAASRHERRTPSPATGSPLRDGARGPWRNPLTRLRVWRCWTNTEVPTVGWRCHRLPVPLVELGLEGVGQGVEQFGQLVVLGGRHQPPE